MCIRDRASITNTSVSLEFGNENRGIVLPWVESEAKVTTTGVVDGTLIYDTLDHKVKLRAYNHWICLLYTSRCV